VHVNALNFQQEVLEADMGVLVDVSSAWCSPCRAAEPVLRQISAEQQEHLRIVKLDAEQAPDLIARLGVRGFPTFVFFRSGQEVGRHAGFRGPRQLQAWIADLLANA
ncbi:MAG: thioredoxin family protein, partial [Myxococcales bacterium]|nr:thioredoxin family protein [Myxococcales bacterium]